MCVSGSFARAFRCLLLLAALIGSAAQAAPRCNMRAMSYNIRLDLASDGTNGWPYRRNELIGQIEIVRPDIMGLQEVLSNQRRDLAAALPDYEFLGLGRDDGKDAGEYSPLGVRKAAFAIGRSGTFWLSPTPDRPSLGWGASYKRIVTWVQLTHRSSGSAILALNTHWDHESLLARRESGAMISRWISQHRRPSERVLLLGDFNAPLAEPSMKILTDAGLADTRATAREVLGGETSFNNFQAIPAKPSPAIDHILVDSSWRVRRHATIAQHVNGKVASDHFPVVADLTLAALSSRCPATNS
jgi:endonuclease/exonuclease/phosphatase family metal-dependent hydrolase